METKNWWTSKTVHIAFLQGIIGIITAVTASPELQGVGWMLVAKSVLDGYLRVITKTEVK